MGLYTKEFFHLRDFIHIFLDGRDLLRSFEVFHLITEFKNSPFKDCFIFSHAIGMARGIV